MKIRKQVRWRMALSEAVRMAHMARVWGEFLRDCNVGLQ